MRLRVAWMRRWDRLFDMSDLAPAWELTPMAAIALQARLRERVRLAPLAAPPRLIAGADVSMEWHSDVVFAGFVILTYPGLEMVDRAAVQAVATFPYVPGLLSFREIPSLLQAWEKLKTKPDLVFVDGVGIAHPRRLGIATHLSLLIDRPTIGCAKSVLTGVYEEPELAAGATSFLRDPVTREPLGMAVRTKAKVKPMFISPGNRLTIQEAADLVLSCTKKHRMPEPTRQAHLFVNEARRAAKGNGASSA